MRKFIILLLLILMANVIYAVPPTRTVLETGAWRLTYPQNDLIKVYDNTNFHVHVFDGNGILKNTSDTNCTIHLYNQSNNHIIREYMAYDSKGDYEIKINGNNFTTPGIYTITVWCGNGTEGGALNEYIEVTDLGYMQFDSTDRLAAIIGIVGLMLAFLYIVFSLDEQHFGLKMLTLFFAIYMMFLLPNIYTIGLAAIKDQFHKIVTWYFRCFAVYVFVYLSYHWAQKSEKLGRMFK